MDNQELKKILDEHKKWIKGERGKQADLRGANLCGADLCGADLRDADLRDANIDYSCLPLWCGGLGIIVDKRIAAQIAYHFCRLKCDSDEFIKARNAVIDFANTFHRVDECGKLELMVKEKQ